MLLQLVEEHADLGRRSVALEVVEQDVVRLVVVVEEAARRTACAGRGSCAGPAGSVAKSSFSRASTQTGIASAAERDISARSSDGTLPRLLPVAPGDADEARLERVVRRVSSPSRARSSSSRPTSSDGELLVRDPPERRELLGPRAARRAAASSSAGPSRGRAAALPRSAISFSRETSSPNRVSSRHARGTLYDRDEAAGRRGSSEDDLPLRLNHAPDRWRRTGSESAAGRAWTRRVPSMRWLHAARARAIASHTDLNPMLPSTSARSRRCAAAFVIGGRHFRASSDSGRLGWRSRSSAISWSFGGRPSTSTPRIASSWACAARARPDEVRAVGVREPVRARPRRGDDRLLVEPQRDVARTRGRDDVRDRLAPFA